MNEIKKMRKVKKKQREYCNTLFYSKHWTIKIRLVSFDLIVSYHTGFFATCDL